MDGALLVVLGNCCAVVVVLGLDDVGETVVAFFVLLDSCCAVVVVLGLADAAVVNGDVGATVVVLLAVGLFGDVLQSWLNEKKKIKNQSFKAIVKRKENHLNRLR